jgi:hypothetical protein
MHNLEIERATEFCIGALKVLGVVNKSAKAPQDFLYAMLINVVENQAMLAGITVDELMRRVVDQASVKRIIQ